MVQIHYNLYMNDKPKNKLYNLALFDIIWVCILKRELILPSILYIGLTFTNLKTVKRLACKARELHPFKWAINQLAFCDSCIVAKKIFKKNKFLNFLFDLLEWGTYIPSQISVFLTGLKNGHLKEGFAR